MDDFMVSIIIVCVGVGILSTISCICLCIKGCDKEEYRHRRRREVDVELGPLNKLIHALSQSEPVPFSGISAILNDHRDPRNPSCG